MRINPLFAAGMFAGIMLNMGNQAVHWFLTPHPDASTLRAIAVGLQALAGFGLAAWLAWRARERHPVGR